MSPLDARTEGMPGNTSAALVVLHHKTIRLFDHIMQIKRVCYYQQGSFNLRRQLHSGQVTGQLLVALLKLYFVCTVVYCQRTVCGPLDSAH